MRHPGSRSKRSRCCDGSRWSVDRGSSWFDLAAGLPALATDHRPSVSKARRGPKTVARGRVRLACNSEEFSPNRRPPAVDDSRDSNTV
jgi:hypothetical protein